VNSQTGSVEHTSLSTNARQPLVVGRIFDVLLRLRALLALLLLVLVFSLTTSSFMTTNNLIILVKHVSINAFLAVGMTFVMLAGGIDLSVDQLWVSLGWLPVDC
jgi:erythritol transport system permease protein